MKARHSRRLGRIFEEEKKDKDSNGKQLVDYNRSLTCMEWRLDHTLLVALFLYFSTGITAIVMPRDTVKLSVCVCV